jgi:hypothetical protein
VILGILPYTPSGSSYACSARFVGTNQNRFSGPAKQVSHKDVVNTLVPDKIVTETLKVESLLALNLTTNTKKAPEGAFL